MYKFVLTLLCSLTFLTLSSCAQARSQEGEEQTVPPENVPAATETGYAPQRQIRLITLAAPLTGGEWMPVKKRGLQKDYTAQDVLEMIADLKPTCLERYITGYHNPDRQVPVREGYPPMTVKEFLNASLQAAAPGCEIVPKLNLQWLGTENGRKLFWESAEKLYALDLVRPIRNINLDCWDHYCNEIHKTPEERHEMFSRLRSIGYEKIGMNFTGLYGVNDPDIDYGDFNIDKVNWVVKEAAVTRLRSYPNVKDIYLYIDYPGPMQAFMEKDPDEQARIYTEVIYPSQEALNIHFVYAIIQDFWCASEIVTSPDGPYGGKTMYDITKELLFKPYVNQ